MSNLLDYGGEGTLIDGSGVATGAWSMIQALEDASVTVTVNWKDYQGVEIPVGKVLEITAGDVRYGTFTSIEVTSGEVVAY